MNPEQQKIFQVIFQKSINKYIEEYFNEIHKDKVNQEMADTVISQTVNHFVNTIRESFNLEFEQSWGIAETFANLVYDMDIYNAVLQEMEHEIDDVVNNMKKIWEK